jgi:mannose-6-phosphate isomerase
VNAAPLYIEPIFSPRIWGARSLAPLYPEKSNLAEPLGEAWLTSVDCRVASGAFEGQTLGAAWQAMPADWRGTGFAPTAGEFPLLVKFIFPKDKLSIQVHPNDAYASAHERAAGGRGKTEMWHAVSAEPHAQVLVGLKPGVDKKKFQSAITSRGLEDFLVAHPVHEGDTFFIPAGTPHTIGPGAILCEVQQYSDLTYRVYDYGRVDSVGKPRALHIDKAMEVMNFGATQAGVTSRLGLPAQDFARTLLVACPYFASERWEVSGACAAKTNASHFDLLVVLAGEGTLHAAGVALPYRQGECYLLPANLGEYRLVPATPTSLIRTYVPDLAALRKELQLAGYTKMVVAGAVFD